MLARLRCLVIVIDIVVYILHCLWRLRELHIMADISGWVEFPRCLAVMGVLEI